MKKLILASASPRRKELLSLLGIDFEIQTADIDETIFVNEKPAEVVSRLAFAKAQKISDLNPDSFVLGSDTLVALEKPSATFEILGKPIDKQDAFGMLKKLQGNTHLVFTAVAIVCKNQKYEFAKVITSKVRFITLSDKEILEYIETGEPMDKAGAYALQGKGSCFIASVEGSFTSVIGLPLSEVYQEINKHVKR